MSDRHSHARRRIARTAVPTVAGALLVALLPTQSLALPPVPGSTSDDIGRSTLSLERLENEVPVPGAKSSRDLETLKADIPQDQLTAPASVTTPPSNLTGTVTFGSTTSNASFRSTANAQQVALSPVGTLPVSLGQAPDTPAPTGTWQVTIPERTSAVGQGIDGTVLKVQAPDTGSVPVSVRLDYSGFESLYGADWASRLRFVQFPSCYLTTPDDEACQTYQELESTNDPAGKSITATVDPASSTVTSATDTRAAAAGAGVAQVSYRTAAGATPAAAGSAAVVGAVDSGSGSGGTFKATPLASDGSWEAGGSSGAFTWSYPLAVPAAPAGPAPKISFDYSSQTVDGRTASSSPQASWIGEGWSYEPGHIERRYRSCQDDRKKLASGTPNNTAAKDKTADLCWVSYNAVMSLNGKTTELIRDASSSSNPDKDTELYRPQQDDGTRVEHRTGGTNGDNNGEYWVVTTTDGTQYYYGLNAVGGGHADTGSVSTVPVFGNHPDEPCHADTFPASRCGAGKQQAWRWGLDKVVDTHGNTMIVNWKQETNYYAVSKKFKSPERYDRYAYPASIEYGLRPDSLTKPSATVEFGVKQRCLKSDSACDPANFAKTDDPGAYRPWWDTPGNLNCKSSSKLCPAFPSFWTQLRLDTVTTKAGRAGQSGIGPVDKYTLYQSFPEDWYDTAPGLWLNSITRTGYGPGDTTGTLQSKDGISFGQYTVGSTSPLHARLKDRQLPNLVLPANSQRPGFTRPRIGVVSTEYGGDTEVEYTGGCANEPAEDKGRSNGTCYPVRWSPDGDEKTPAKAWFNKYVVASVTENDKVTSHGRPVTTTYQYTGPAWAKGDDEFTRPALRTYADWRGYRQVKALKGSKSISEQGDVSAQSMSVTRYFQGTGGEVKDSKGERTLVADDAPQYAGMTAETLTYRDSGGPVLKRTLNVPWSKQTASRPRENEDGTPGAPLNAFRAGTRQTDEIQTLDDDSWRAVRTVTSVDDTYGLPIQVETAVVRPNGTGESFSDRTCAKTSYVHNTSVWLIGLPKEERTTATACTGFDAADPATQLKSATRISYDKLAYGAAPTKGEVSSIAETDGRGSSYSVVTTTTYDDLGRIRIVTQPDSGPQETQYTPDTGGPVTLVKTINAMGQATTTTVDPGRSLPLTVTDPNGRTSRTEYDALGRLVKGWSPSRSSGGKSPNVVIDYAGAVANPSQNRPAAVTVSTLKDDGTYAREITLYDGLAREVQKQSEAHGPGRVITDTSYDDHGLPYEQTGGYLAKGEPAADLFTPRSTSLIPRSVKHRYDGMEREIRTSVYHSGDFTYATYISYTWTSTYVDPAGPTAPKTRTYYDALGRATSVKHYSQDADGSSAGRTTTYDYDARGNRDKVTDPAGNIWSSVYDARGRIKSTTDPDTGTTETWYDAADRPNRVKNSRGQETFTAYDLLGRITDVRQGSATATPVKEYRYDDAPGGIGQPSLSKRHTDTGDYVNKVTGYDTEYNVTGNETTIPANAMTTGLAGTYAYAYTYTPTGKPQSVTLPAAGGLAQEKVVTRYDDGLSESTSGLTWYTADVTYSPYGEPLRTVSGTQPYRVWTTNFVDPHTGSLERTVADRETDAPHRITDSYYSYDVSGTITSNARQLTEATGSTWDTQCFTYDALGELTHAWTSNIAPAGKGTGCKAANGATWGPRTDYTASTGPVADAPDEATDTSAPDAALSASLLAAAPNSTTVSTGATAYRQAYTFDWLGNRATLTEHDTADPSKNVTYTYGYGKTVAANGTVPAYRTQPHTATTISSSPSGKGSLYTYDATGNTLVRDLANTTQNLVWTAENKLDSLTDDGKKTTYVYDAEGNRLLENSASGSTLYLGETELTTNATGTITRASRSYTQSGAPTVVRTTTNGATTGHRLSVLLADQLGTANTTVELTANQTVTRRAYKPYGELRGQKPSNWPNKRGYLGVGIDDTATGLTHLGAREYDQTASRFLSADPVIDFAAPLQMNGYTYSSNSPISNSDPTGLCADLDCPTRATPNHENRTPTHPAPAGKPKHSQNYKAAVSAGNVAPAAVRKKYVEIYPGVYVERNWKYRLQYQEKLFTEIRIACHGQELDCFLNAENQEVAQNFFKHIKFLACMRLGRDSGCGGKFSALSAVAMIVMTGGSEGPGGLSGAGPKMPESGPKTSGAGSNSIASCKCFLAGTDVLMADGTTKNIEDVQVGDLVKATEPRTGKTKSRKVTRLIRTNGDKYFNELSIATSDGIQHLTATHEHPFWSPSERDWIEAGALKPGMTLLTDDGSTVIVRANRSFTRQARTYNLTVDELHTYYVLAGKTPVLVHNSARCPTAIILGPRPAGVGDDWVGRGADNGKGTVWQKPGSTGNGDMVRVMDPTGRYPDGYVRFHNKSGQPIGLNGKPGSKADTHIPMNPDGTYPLPVGW